MEAPTGLIIRKAEPWDAMMIHRVFVSAIWEISDSYYDHIQKQAWENAVAPESWSTRMLEFAFIVAETAGEVVGFASWSDFQLEHFYVAASHGGQGIGSKLLESVLSNFKEKEISLVASNNAASLYSKFGFVEEEQLVKQLGSVEVSCIRMKRPAV